METVILPERLFVPFQSLINCNVAVADQHVKDWLLRFKLVKTQRQLDHYRSQGFAWMVARMFPNADVKILCAFTDLNTLLFLLDDYLDHAGKDEGNEKDKDFKTVSNLINTFVSILDPIPPQVPDDPIFLAMVELWGRITRLSSRAWQKNFRVSVRQIFEAAIWQHTNVMNGIRPSVKDYMNRRQYLGAANIATDTISVADNIRLPVPLYQHPLIVKLTEIARNVVCWANDLFSLSKEVDHGDYHNLVVLLENQYKVSREQAIGKAIQIHDRQVKQFIHLSKKLPFSDPHTKQEVVRYISGLENIMKANIDWSDYETSRYVYSYAKEIKEPSIRSHYLLNLQY